jgi:hypothetical protein
MSGQGKRRRRGRRTSIEGQFVTHQIEMLRSPAWRALSLSARKVLDRIEIEQADHGGADNGKLPVTYADFTKYGIDNKAIAPAIRELDALGIIEVTERGRPSKADWRFPNKFRLTYLPTHDAAPTQEWRRIKDRKEAAAIAKSARAEKDTAAVQKSKIAAEKRRQANEQEAKSHGGKTPPTVGAFDTPTVPGGQNTPTALGVESPLLSISRGG